MGVYATQGGVLAVKRKVNNTSTNNIASTSGRGAIDAAKFPHVYSKPQEIQPHNKALPSRMLNNAANTNIKQ